MASPNFVCGDAQRIPFADNTFDIVTVGYGLRNLASWEAGLREMQRVANPGGRLVVLEFGKPDNTLWRRLYFGYLKLFVPCLGRIFCGSASAYAYILESLQHYPAQQGVAAKMRELGLLQVRVVSLLGGVMSINYGEKRSDGVLGNGLFPPLPSIRDVLPSTLHYSNTPLLQPSITPFPLSPCLLSCQGGTAMARMGG
jgi:SAM-dependent methyltransferase